MAAPNTILAVKPINNFEAYKQLPAIRELLSQGKNDQAEALVNKAFECKGEGSGRGKWS